MTETVKTNGVDTAYRFDGPVNGRVVLMSNSLMSPLSHDLSCSPDRQRGDLSEDESGGASRADR